jgi:hypothetical protein
MLSILFPQAAHSESAPIRKDGLRMDNEFAGRDDSQCGQRFLDSSASRLKRHVVSCESAGRGTEPPPAGKDEKLSWGFRGEAPDTRGLAACSSSLDKVQTNRDRPKGWKRNCGRFSVRGESYKTPGKYRFCRVGCKCWGCSGCGPRRASMYCIRIRETAERHKLNKLVTLTLDPAKLQGEDSTRYINEVFADFRVYLRRKLGHTPSYIRVLEYQKNGNAHLHILVNCWLDQHWISEAWCAVGGGHIVDIRMIDMHRISHYLSKYLTKQMIECAPPRARRVTTSRDIRLLENDTPGEFRGWLMMRAPIRRLLDICAGHITTVTNDQDGFVLAFEAFLNEMPTLENLVPTSNVRSTMFAKCVLSQVSSANGEHAGGM